MKSVVLFTCLFSMLVGCSSSASKSAQPSLAEQGKNSKPTKSSAMVVTANPHATAAGIAILEQGGSAVDAAIAIEAVLSLVEPQSSGLGGGGFMVHFENQTNRLTVYDGRETAPSSATADMFLEPDGSRMRYLNAKHSGLSTGVPGMVSMLALAHQDFGQIPWGLHFDAARKLATEGFAVSPRLNGMIKRFGKYLPKTIDQGPTDAYRYFHDDDDQPLAVGHILKNPAYAEALDTIAGDPRAFYEGKLAEQIIAAVAAKPRPAQMSREDLASFQAKRRTALCIPYKNDQLCGPPPPSSWVAVGMTMAILDRSVKSTAAGAADPFNWNLFGEAQRLAYADRDKYIADADTVLVPLTGLTNPNYLTSRASQLSSVRAVEKIEPGDPWAFQDQLPLQTGEDATVDKAGTTHFVVVDKQGNVVSLTASVESIFGSARMVGGMFLNNQLTDFSFQEKDQAGNLIANSVAPGKRPRSSMSPTIVLDQNGEFKMATGSPGGNSIIAYTAKTLVGVLDWGLSPQQAVDLPNLVARGDVVRIESARADQALIKGLRDYGFEVKESSGENSGLSVVLRHADGRLEGGVDPRREGVIATLED